MSARRARMVLGIGMGLFLFGLGALGGIAVERMRFEPGRAAMLARYEAVVRAYEAPAMAVE